MSTSDHFSGKPTLSIPSAGRHESVDETVARFLITSAHYLKLPAERQAQSSQQNNCKPETGEQS